MQRVLVSFLWHMHQPFYKDLVRQSYVMPWAYLHGTKDYFGMPALLEEFPQVHQTFNLVPSLVVQLEEYARGEARDALLELAFKPVDQLTAEERSLVIERFFPVPVRTMIQPFPRYFELYERRNNTSRHHAFSDQDIRDIQVWWTLAWMDHDRRPKDMVEKRRDFSESDKVSLRRRVEQIIQSIIPEYRRMQDRGIIEISTTPFYHPILPILIDSRVDDGNVPVAVQFPYDAREQLSRSLTFMRDRFGVTPQGLWPSEGSVSNDVALLASSVGFRWMATDEGILSKSGVDLSWGNRSRLYQPYRRNGMTVFFRDRTLSDLIGFQYMNAPATESARDLIRRLKELPGGSHVTIALDGENPWDYYPNSGRDFLRRLFEGIQNDSSLQAVTLSEAMERRPAEKLDWLAPGSWANANFQIWIGHPEDHQAWRWIVRAREALMQRKDDVPEVDWNLAYEELLIAEGSDWMWWFGNDFSSDSDAIFDSLFRQHIKNIYHFIGLPEPEGLDEPIKKSLEGRKMVMAPPPPLQMTKDQ
ncbi:MAG: glycoside hydrolase [Acidobacteria bacterium]|nr:MAG: glycoside hydrolase [Acidobacteriota bacterium]